MELADVCEAERGLREGEQQHGQAVQNRVSADDPAAPGRDGGHEMEHHR
ncbi:hypothetical protein ACGFZH_21810 [Streptomyces zaomyceticus]